MDILFIVYLEKQGVENSASVDFQIYYDTLPFPKYLSD